MKPKKYDRYILDTCLDQGHLRKGGQMGALLIRRADCREARGLKRIDDPGNRTCRGQYQSAMRQELCLLEWFWQKKLVFGLVVFCTQ